MLVPHLIVIVVFVIGLLLLFFTFRSGFRDLFRLAEAQTSFFETASLPSESVASPSETASSPAADSADEPLISVVVVCDRQGSNLEQNLPFVLQQNFESFEVIVVNVASEDRTSDALKRLSQDYPQLRQTYVPKTSRNLNRKKLGYTLGIRAARAEWVAIISPDCVPDSYDWLRTLWTFVSDAADIDVVMGYVNYADRDEEGGRRAVFERANHFLALAHAALSGQAIGVDDSNLLLRRQWFLDCDGFAESLSQPFGTFTHFVGDHAEADRVAVSLYSSSFVHQELPYDVVLRDNRVYAIENQRYLKSHLPFHRRFPLWRERWATKGYFLLLFGFLGYLGFRILTYAPLDEGIRGWFCRYTTLSEVGTLFPAYAPAYEWWWLGPDVSCLVLFVYGLVLIVRRYERLMAVFEESPFGSYALIYLLLQPWRSYVNRRRYRKARRDFVTQTL